MDSLQIVTVTRREGERVYFTLGGEVVPKGALCPAGAAPQPGDRGAVALANGEYVLLAVYQMPGTP